MAVFIDRAAGNGASHPPEGEGNVPLLMLIVLMSGGILATMTFTTVTPSLTFIADHFGAKGGGIFGAQLILTMAPLGMALTGPFTGTISQRVGLKRQLFGGLLLFGFAGAMAQVVDTIGTFLLVRFTLGFASVNIQTAMTSILGARFTGARRARLVGIQSGISSIGTLATVLLSGEIGQAYGWRAAFWMYMLAFVILALAVAAFREPLGKAPHQPASAHFSVFSLWPIYALTMVMSIAHTMPSFQMGFLLKDDGLTSPVALSRILALSSVISILGSFMFGTFYGKIGRWTVVVAMALLGVGYTVIGLVHTIPVEIVGIVVSGFGAGFVIPYMIARVLDRVTAEKRTQALGFLISSMFLGHFFNPLFVKPIRDNFGNHPIFLITGLLLGAGGLTIALAWLAKRPPSPTETLAAAAE